MMDKTDSVVIGAGVVGLAVARALALSGRDVIVIEANSRIGAEISSRNNEVVHGGYLYPPNSLKAQLCRPGREMLYAYCDEAGIRYRRVGKLVLALGENELAMLAFRMEQRRINRVADLQLLDRMSVRELEPGLECLAAVFSPSTGIVDSHALMLAYQADAERHGAMIALNSIVIAGRIDDGGFTLDIASPDDTPYRLGCTTLVNAAGLGARDFALALAGYPSGKVPHVHYPKGICYALTGPAPFRHLIVTMGETMAAGGSFTLDLAGQGRFGPDVFEWAKSRDYSPGPDRRPAFGGAIRRFFPAFDESRIHPSYAAIRPRIGGPGQPMSDWMVEGPAQHGIDNLVQMFAIESPGLTSSLALGDYVADMLSPGGGT